MFVEERTTLPLPADKCAAKIARTALHDFGVIAEADVVVTELVANAVLHGKPPFTLRIVRTEHHVRIEVDDERPDLGTNREDSIGLRIVEAFSIDWGVRRHRGDGKTVWADFVA